MPKGRFVGSEACHFCQDGRVGWFETEKSAPAHPKIWGYCGGDPDYEATGCGSRLYLGVKPSRERYRAADTPGPSPVNQPEEPENGNFQTSEPEPAGEPEPVAETEPANDDGSHVSFFPTG